MLLLLTIVACSGDTPTVTRAEVSERVTLDSMARLGTWQMHATWSRTKSRDGAAPQTRATSMELLWVDLDHWCYSRLAGDVVESRMLVRDAVGWEQRGTGRWSAGRDPQALRTQLDTTWDPWDEALSWFAGRITYTPVGSEEIAGRKAEHYTLGLEPEPELKGKQKPKVAGPWKPTSLEGDLWVDQETAVRLQAKVKGAARGQGQEMQVELVLGVSGIGEDPGLPDPAGPAPAGAPPPGEGAGAGPGAEPGAEPAP